VTCSSDGAPLAGPQYVARLYDDDVLRDDFLGKSRLDPGGQAQFTFPLDESGEAKPDLYLALRVGDRQILQTPSFKNRDFLQPSPVTGLQTNLTQDLGTFRIKT
jgi:hypothetical protein